MGSSDGKLAGDQGGAAEHFPVLGLDLDHPGVGAWSCGGAIDNPSVMNCFATRQWLPRPGPALAAGLGAGGELDRGVGLGVVVLPGYELGLSRHPKQVAEALPDGCNELVHISTGLQVFLSGLPGYIIIDNDPVYCKDN